MGCARDCPRADSLHTAASLHCAPLTGCAYDGCADGKRACSARRVWYVKTQSLSFCLPFSLSFLSLSFVVSHSITVVVVLVMYKHETM